MLDLDRRPAPPLLRWVLVLVGLAVIGVAVAAATGPFRDSLDYRRVEDCENRVGGCFARERVTVVDRHTYVDVTRDDDGERRERVYEVTWERPDGGRTTRKVARRIFTVAAVGGPADLRTWRGEVVGIEVSGAEQWFTPRTGWHLAGWLGAGWLGLGLVLWGLLLSWWDGVFMSVFRLFFWTFMGVVPATLAMALVLYEPPTGGSLLLVVGVALVFTGVPAGVLWATFRE